MSYFIELKEKFNKITEYKYFEELFAIALGLITLFGWGVNSIAGMSILIVIAAIVLLLTGDLKYVIPSTIYMVFCINKGFNNDEAPIPIIITGGLFVIILLIQAFKNGIKLSKMKSAIGLTGLAVVNIIPIFWSNNIPKENGIFYTFFFVNFAYLLLYVIFVNGIKKDSFNLLAHAMTYLGIVLTIECMCKVIELHDTVENILDLWYYLGWGLCNEAGILICMSLPFTFYLLGNSKSTKEILLNNFKILLMCVGIVLTTSRGSFLFGGLEVIALYISLFFVAKDNKLFCKITSKYLGAIIVTCIIFSVPIYMFVRDIMDHVFPNGVDPNGRVSLWKQAYEMWMKGPLETIFGPGMPCVIAPTPTPNGYQDGMIVFHSTIMETLAIGGILALGFLIIHFIEKYKCIYNTNNKLLFTTMVIGFICVDLYGMIDNTYHMYYYMFPLMVILSTIDNKIYLSNKIQL